MQGTYSAENVRAGAADDAQKLQGPDYEKRHTKQGTQTNLTLKDESNGDWLPKCDEPAATPTQPRTGKSRSFSF